MCLVYQNDQKNWQWLNMSQILLILVYMRYTKINWYVDWYTAFFVIPTVFSIPEATRNDYFWLVYNWYMASWYMYNDLFFAVTKENKCIRQTTIHQKGFFGLNKIKEISRRRRLFGTMRLKNTSPSWNISRATFPPSIATIFKEGSFASALVCSVLWDEQDWAESNCSWLGQIHQADEPQKENQDKVLPHS